MISSTERSYFLMFIVEKWGCARMGGRPSPERGDLGNCLLMPAVSIGACHPRCLYGDGEVLPHGLRGGLCLATCPDDLAGLEIGCHAHDHWSVSRLVCDQSTGSGVTSDHPMWQSPIRHVGHGGDRRRLHPSGHHAPAL